MRTPLNQSRVELLDQVQAIPRYRVLVMNLRGWMCSQATVVAGNEEADFAAEFQANAGLPVELECVSATRSAERIGGEVLKDRVFGWRLAATLVASVVGLVAAVFEADGIDGHARAVVILMRKAASGSFGQCSGRRFCKSRGGRTAPQFWQGGNSLTVPSGLGTPTQLRHVRSSMTTNAIIATVERIDAPETQPDNRHGGGKGFTGVGDPSPATSLARSLRDRFCMLDSCPAIPMAEICHATIRRIAGAQHNLQLLLAGRAVEHSSSQEVAAWYQKVVDQDTSESSPARHHADAPHLLWRAVAQVPLPSAEEILALCAVADGSAAHGQELTLNREAQ